MPCFIQTNKRSFKGERKTNTFVCPLFLWFLLTCFLVWFNNLSEENTFEIQMLLEISSYSYRILQGCILNLKFIFMCPPPPSWFIFLPNLKFLIIRGARRRWKMFSFFFCNFVYLKLIGEKLCIFPPFFLSPFNFPQPVIWRPTEKYTPLKYCAVLHVNMSVYTINREK